MTEYVSSEGAVAGYYTSADYSDNHFSYPIDGQFDAYYITRYAFAVDTGAVASLTGNSVTLYGSSAADQVFVNAQLTAANNSSATSYGNNWFVSLGEGDDASVIHTLVSGVGAGSVANLSFDTSTLSGGAGADILHATQYLSALDGASASIAFTSRVVEGGEGFDQINAGFTIESGRTGFAGGTASHSYNNLFVDAGADGGNIFAVNFVTASNGGSANVVGNSATFLGGSFLNAGASITSGSADATGGTVNYDYNSLYAQTGPGGGSIYAQNWISTYQGGYASFSGNSITLMGQSGSDILNSGIGVTSGSAQFGTTGGYGNASNNFFYADGGAGADTVNLFLNGMADAGGSVAITGNSFYGAGGEGDDTLDLNWWTFVNGGDAQISGNVATMDAGAGSDTLFAYLGEGTSGNIVTLRGGDGNDSFQTTDWGQNNQRLISGGAGDDSIVDDIGFSTAQFAGAFADYTVKAIGRGWISVTDNRDGSPDGADRLYQVDQLSFSDGSVLISDLYLPIEGTEGDDTLFGGPGDDIILGHGGNDTLWGSFGNDIIDGGAGNDLLIGQSGNDTVIGGDGDDQVIGNTGADQLSGGAGADIFAYGNRNQSTLANPDLIVDFSGAVVLGTNSQGQPIRKPGEGDKIDLSTIDADITLAGNQAFTIVQHGFSGAAGELYASFDAATGITSIFLDVDGDASADMEIQLLGQASLTGADFIL